MDTSKGYKTEVRISSSQKSIFQAISRDIDEWWGTTDGLIEGVGGTFKVSWGEPWYEFRVTEFMPYVKICWECIDANQIINGLDKVQKEWVGSTIHWNIYPINENSCRLKMFHEGLIPEMVCYDVCSSIWSRFIHNNLKYFLESGS